MAAYFVVMQQVHDTDRYLNEYVPRVMPFLEKHGGEVLAAGFEGEALEGDPPNSTIVIRFPDAAFGASTTTVPPDVSIAAWPESASRITPPRKFTLPTKLATKRVAGRPYTFSGMSSCSILPITPTPRKLTLPERG